MAGSRSIFTRRRALQLGAAAGATVAFGGPVSAARASATAPRYLRRATYAMLVGQGFAVGGRMLSLEDVGDLAGAAGDPSLRGHDEAFALSFTGAPGLPSATQTVSHPAFGTVALLVVPVEMTGRGSQRYEVVIDRSVGRPADPPSPAPDRASPPEHPGSEEAAAKALAAAGRKAEAKAVEARRARVRRGRKQRTTGRARITRRRRAVRRRRTARRAPRRA